MNKTLKDFQLANEDMTKIFADLPPAHFQKDINYEELDELFKLTDGDWLKIEIENGLLSNMLSEAIIEIERYQHHSVFRSIYEPMKEEIDEVKDAMQRLIEKLKAAP